MRRLFALSALAALTALVCLPANAQTLYSDLSAFSNAATTTQLFDFEGIAPTNGYTTGHDLSPLTVTIEGGNSPDVYIEDSGESGGTYSLNGTDSLVAGLAFFSVPTVTLAFENSVTAFATEIGFRNSNGPVPNSFTAQLFNGGAAVGNVFTSADPALFNAPTFSTGFFGVTSAIAFDRIKITTNSINSGGTFQGYDNVRFGNLKSLSSAVPEPGTLALLGLALPVAGLVQRRKA